MTRKIAVLDTSVEAREVAETLEIEIHKKGDDESENVVIIVTKREEIKTVEWAITIRNVVGIITWMLDEKDVLSFCEFDIPVFVGKVAIDQLEAGILKKGSKNVNELEKDKTQRLATIEELLEMNDWE